MVYRQRLQTWAEWAHLSKAAEGKLEHYGVPGILGSTPRRQPRQIRSRPLRRLRPIKHPANQTNASSKPARHDETFSAAAILDDLSGTGPGQIIQSYGQRTSCRRPTRLGASEGVVINTTVVLARGLLWNRPPGGRKRQQPVVILLGPVGAGKSAALTAISRDCGGGVVHARFDFRRPEPVTTVEVLARLAFDLSGKWQARPRARFLRFTLGLIAVLAPLEDTLIRENARTRLQEAINRAFPGHREVESRVQTLTDAAVKAQILTPLLAQAINLALPSLVRAIERQPLRRAGNWYTDMPQADGAVSALDALVTLNQKARKHPPDMTAWLTAAFLADVRESHLRMSAPDVYSSCHCDNPDKTRHLHNWVLLLDDLHCPGGTEFVTDLQAAREHHLRQHPGDHDALAVIASSGRWNPEWESGWLPPWKSPENRPERANVVPRCRNADYGHWAETVDATRRPHPYYPVLLEPLDFAETAGILAPGDEALGIDDETRVRRVLVQRATGGLPAHVHSLAAVLRGQEVRPGSRDALHPSSLGIDSQTWRSQVNDLRLTTHLAGIVVDDVVSATPFATAPWLVHADSVNLAAQAHVGLILTELRTALWVVAPHKGGGTPDHAELQPWIARTLLAALAERSTAQDGPSYREQFETLLYDPATQADPVRTAYCRLALGRIADVVGYFEANFQDLPHQQWVDQLELVTSAPDDKPLDRDCDEIYEELVAEDLGATGVERTTLRNTVARLVAARWLVANPFTTPTSTLRDIVVNSYEGLVRESHRADVAPLVVAAVRTRKMF